MKMVYFGNMFYVCSKKLNTVSRFVSWLHFEDIN